jgi:hypothetical protein
MSEPTSEGAPSTEDPRSVPEQACPHLGLRADPASIFMTPTEEHRCQVAGHRQRIDLGHQATFCLSDSFEACPRFSAVSAPPASPKLTEKLRKWRGLAVGRPSPMIWRPIQVIILIILLVSLGLAFVLWRALDERPALTALPAPVVREERIVGPATGVGTSPPSVGAAPQQAFRAEAVATGSARATATVAPGGVAIATSPAPQAATGGELAATRSVASTSVSVAVTLQPSPTAEATPRATAATLLGTAAAAVAEAEVALRTGEIEAEIDYGAGRHGSARLVFDRGQAGTPPRLQVTTTYGSGADGHTTERIVIGERSWERQSGGAWTAGQTRESVLGQIRAYLPGLEPGSEPGVESNGQIAVLRWYDAARDVDVVLHVDPSTGVPRQKRRVTRATGSVLTVAYGAWNTPVEIAAPDSP